jgi:hypothetical protein
MTYTSQLYTSNSVPATNLNVHPHLLGGEQKVKGSPHWSTFSAVKFCTLQAVLRPENRTLNDLCKQLNPWALEENL